MVGKQSSAEQSARMLQPTLYKSELKLEKSHLSTVSTYTHFFYSHTNTEKYSKHTSQVILVTQLQKCGFTKFFKKIRIILPKQQDLP